MALITHVFESHERIHDGVVVSHDDVARRANFVYDPTGSIVDITIIPTLSTKRAHLTRQVGFTLYYREKTLIIVLRLNVGPTMGQ